METMEKDLRSILDKNISQTRARIATAANNADRDADGIVLVAVSKRQPQEKIDLAYSLGIRHFGENQIQEGVEKVEVSAKDIVWHFIGHLQKNKARKAVKYFQYIHGIDSLALLERVNNLAGEERVHPKVFLQVNYVGEEAKSGMAPEEVSSVLEKALAMKHITCVGLMGMPPQKSTAEEITAYFQGMAQLRDRLQEEHQWTGSLSLGMSGDFEIAIAEGASYIRLGSTLFGARLQK